MMPLRQVWEVAPHLCGFTADVMRRRLILTLKVFIDESGKDGPVFVMGGFIARAEQWAAFNEEWQAILESPPRTDAFHMAQAKWAGQDSKLPKLVEVIKRHAITGIAVTVFNEDYAKAFKGKIASRMDRPYFVIFYWIIVSACFWQLENNLDEKMDFVFDEQDDMAPFIQSILGSLISEGPPEIKSRVGVLPVYANDRHVLPLQAADILCWCLRRFGALAFGMLFRALESVLKITDEWFCAADCRPWPRGLWPQRRRGGLRNRGRGGAIGSSIRRCARPPSVGVELGSPSGHRTCG
jgi:hypothetical protein